MSRVAPHLDRSYHLTFVGDWGQANFHRICSWLCEEFCGRTGPKSRVAIWSIRAGGIEAIDLVQEGEVDLCIATPAALMSKALTGEAIFTGRAAPNLRALATLPQKDCMVLALDSRLGITSIEELFEKKPALKIATSSNDGTNFIGYASDLYLQSHGLTHDVIKSWGGEIISDTHPFHSFERIDKGDANALLQEAIMSGPWAQFVESAKLIPLSATEDALKTIQGTHNLLVRELPSSYWNGIDRPIRTLDFSDFVVLVRDDMRDDVAHLLTWCLSETRHIIERQYKHLPPDRSPLSYPLNPANMAKTPVPLHPGAEEYYANAGWLKRNGY